MKPVLIMSYSGEKQKLSKVVRDMVTGRVATQEGQ